MPRRCQGFTLLELMIVMVLAGILLGIVSFAIGGNHARAARQDAEAIVRMVQQLRNRAVREGQEYGVRISTDGYRAVRLAGQDWQSVTELYLWPTELRLRLEQEGQFMSLGHDEGPPQLLALSSDETSEFSLTFFIQDKTLLRLSSDGLSQVVLGD